MKNNGDYGYGKYFITTNSHATERSQNKYFDSVFKRFLPNRLDSSIVDIGSGCGDFLAWLQSIGYSNIKGYDIDNNLVERCRSRNLNVIQSSPGDILVAMQSLQADAIFVLDVLEHLDSDYRHIFLSSLSDGLKEGGLIILKVPNASFSFANNYLYDDPTHKCLFGVKALSWQLQSAGFNVLGFYEDDYLAWCSCKLIIKGLVRYLFRLIRRVEAAIDLGEYGLRHPLSPNIVAVAERSKKSLPSNTNSCTP